jgi:hypothetical protein
MKKIIPIFLIFFFIGCSSNSDVERQIKTEEELVNAFERINNQKSIIDSLQYSLKDTRVKSIKSQEIQTQLTERLMQDSINQVLYKEQEAQAKIKHLQRLLKLHKREIAKWQERFRLSQIIKQKNRGDYPDADKLLGLKKEGVGWKMVKIPQNHFVKGFTGNYYRIDLYQINNNEKLKFETGEYTKFHYSEDDGIGLSNFISDVVKPVQMAGHIYELFIRGSADILGEETFSRSFVLGGEYSYIPYLHLVTGSIIDFDSLDYYAVVEPIYNNDLPNLRAEYMKRSTVMLDGSIKTPYVLEGIVTPDEDEEDRCATIYLYIKQEIRI